MADKTAQQCIYRALTEMGKLYAGEAPSAGDYSIVEDLHEPLIAQLSAEGVYYIDDPEAVDEAIFIPYCRLLAVAAAPSFGVEAIATLIGRNNSENVNALETRDRATLRRIKATAPTGETLKTLYY